VVIKRRKNNMDEKELLNLNEDVIEPETLINEFPKLDSLERQKLYVYRILRRSRAAYEDLNVFENVCLVLNDISPNVEIMEGLSPEQIWKAVGIIHGIYPEIEFSHEVSMYIKMMCNEGGCFFYPENLELENDILPAIKKLAANGPFPLEENFLGIQAAKYLKIVSYLGE
tara:strand:- start:1688 stop:2197 length:510 start_codon:yes stop_codon:yes gene_type:complete